ncbi:MAG: 5-(carboxyamino)imidazole ribonucleotide synthase [Chloroflexi bacterium]|nr:5-(carboxyamino)imidazole ribonucleotide synthase [Chloroflexota bacterium]
MTRVGVLGGGQLGRMLALAGYPLDLSFRFLDPAPDAAAGRFAEHIVGDYSDVEVLSRFASGLDVITYEFENVPVDSARLLSKLTPVYPPPQALEMAQDRVVEKSFFRRLGILTPDFAQVDTRSGLDVALSRIGLPAVLKTRRFGYDGKGQLLLRRPDDVEQAWDALGGRSLILERLVPFDRELSVIAVRDRKGSLAFYPLVENHHSEGILRLSLAPAPELAPAMQSAAEEYATRLLKALDYVGVLAIELFQVGGELIANEMAPRVHNSGHWTIEGAATSQFENHLRAIAGLPLGSTTAMGFSAMLNIIGELPDAQSVLAVPGAHLHLYGKAPRPGRKLGHITLSASNLDTLKRGVEQLQIAMPSPLH